MRLIDGGPEGMQWFKDEQFYRANKMNNLKVIENLGFVYVETQVVGNVGGEFSNQDVDMYVNNTHRIFHWKLSNKFSIKNLKTTRTTMIIEFNSIMRFYFNEIDK